MISDLNNKGYDPLLTGAEPLVFTLAALDIPIALVADTVLLPCDLLQERSNMNRLKALKDKYLPGYQIVKDDGGKGSHRAHFKLISPSGETMQLSQYLSDEDGTNRRLNDLLRQNNIKVSDRETVIEIDTLIFMLLNGEIVNPKWEYQVSRTQDSWNLTVVDKETKKVRLGYKRVFVVDDNDILQKVRRKGF